MARSTLVATPAEAVQHAGATAANIKLYSRCRKGSRPFYLPPFYLPSRCRKGSRPLYLPRKKRITRMYHLELGCRIRRLVKCRGTCLAETASRPTSTAMLLFLATTIFGALSTALPGSSCSEGSTTAVFVVRQSAHLSFYDLDGTASPSHVKIVRHAVVIQDVWVDIAISKTALSGGLCPCSQEVCIWAVDDSEPKQEWRQVHAVGLELLKPQEAVRWSENGGNRVLLASADAEVRRVKGHVINEYMSRLSDVVSGADNDDTDRELLTTTVETVAVLPREQSRLEE